MPKPVLLTVDDDPEVLRAIERDLRSRYSNRYRVMRANSGSAALDTLRELKARNNPVALLPANQRMPQMDGREFYERLAAIKPDLADRIIFLTGDVIDDQSNAFLQAIPNPRLAKPFSLESIERAVCQLLEPAATAA